MLKSCIHCSKKMNSTVRICPHCGGENPKEIIREDLLCPLCKCAMEEHSYRGSTIDICPQCNGLWMDTEDFDYHTSERDVFSDDSIPRKYQRQPLKKDRGDIQCLRCDTLMNVKNFRGISGVLIDVCRDHGVWLDAGELEQIRSFIANGGLNKSQDSDILRNRLDIELVARETKELKTVFKSLNKYNVKRIMLQGF